MNRRQRLGLVAKALFAVFVAVFAYGLYRFPDAPIRYVDGLYVGKFGGIHSREEFERFRLWELVFFGTCATMSAVAYRYGNATR